MTVERIYIEDHLNHMEGQNTMGVKEKFDYWSFFGLTELVEVGDKFSKDSGNFIFTSKRKI